MNRQSKCLSSKPPKIVFYNIFSKINIHGQDQYAFVIRINKTSSQQTSRKFIQNSALLFDDVLTLSFNQQLLPETHPKKQKCDFLLYKYRINQDKQIKQLIGMASIYLTNQILKAQQKKLKLTNSFDKQAFIQCKIKILLEEAHNLSQVLNLQEKESKINLFHLQSEKPLDHYFLMQNTKNNPNSSSATNSVFQIDQTPSSSRISLNSPFEDKHFCDSFEQCSINSVNEAVQNIEKKQIESEIMSLGPPVLSQLREKTDLVIICKSLQKQNQMLMKKIENLENQMQNQNIVQTKSRFDSHSKIPKTGTAPQKSPMIKKNITISMTPSFSSFQQCANFGQQGLLLNSNEKNLKKEQIKDKILSISQLKQSKTEQRLKIENRETQFLSKKIEVNQYQNQNNQVELKQLTFRDEKFVMKRTRKLEIISIIQVKFIPNTMSKYRTVPNENKKFGNRSFLSADQKKNDNSYTKFFGKKKYQLVGVIKSSNSSEINISHNKNQKSILQDWQKTDQTPTPLPFLTKNKDILLKGQEFQETSLSILKDNKKNGKVFLDLLQQSENNNHQLKEETKNIKFANFFHEPADNVENQEKIKTSNISKDRIYKSNETQFLISQSSNKYKKKHNNQIEINKLKKSRLTFEQIDIKTQERFRKNERQLLSSKKRMLEAYNQLKREKKMIELELLEKKNLSLENFKNLQTQIASLKNKIQLNDRVKEESKLEHHRISNKIALLEEENAKLKKDLKDQKAKYQYYFKMSIINDDKQKQRQNLNSFEQSFYKKGQARLGSVRLGSELTSIQSPKIGQKYQRIVTSIQNLKKFDDSKLSSKIYTSLSNKKAYEPENGNSTQKIELSRPSIPKPKNSNAINKLKMHNQPGIPKLPFRRNSLEQNFQTESEENISLIDYDGSQNFGGLIGTGETIIRNGKKLKNIFSS